MGAKSRYRSFYKADLVCPICKSKFPIIRPVCKMRPLGHIKTMYCYGCKATRNLIELGFYGGHLREEVERVITTVDKDPADMRELELKAELLRNNALREILLDENNRHVPLNRVTDLADRIEALETELEGRTA